MKHAGTFALIGAGGYIAPCHTGAIKAVGGDLLVAFDPNDSVGILDSHFPDANFLTEFKRFDRHLDKLCRRGTEIDRMAVCSPNYLHDVRPCIEVVSAFRTAPVARAGEIHPDSARQILEVAA